MSAAMDNTISSGPGPSSGGAATIGRDAPETYGNPDNWGRTEVATRLGRGIDFGSTHVLAVERNEDGHCVCRTDRNAFLKLPPDVSMKPAMLTQLDVPYAEWKDRLWVLGDASYNLANLYVGNTVQRPTANGFLDPHDRDGHTMTRCLIERLVPAPRAHGEPVCFSMPSTPIDQRVDRAAHRAILADIFYRLGYSAYSLDEGHAVVYSEFMGQGFTGIGISCGGGVSDVCVSWQARPVTSHSVARGGDWIDGRIAEVLGIDRERARALKQGDVDLRAPRNREEVAIALCYRMYVGYLLSTLRKSFDGAENLPRFDAPLEIAVAGGASLARGFVDLMTEELRKFEFPVPIGNVRLASDPLSAVARGCLMAASLAD